MVISEYYSEDGTKSAVVLKHDNKYILVCAGGDSSKVEFDSLSSAEDAAEDWVL